MRSASSARPAPVRRPGGRPARAAKTGELATLQVRLAEAEETLRAIRTGEVDAVVSAGKKGLKVFTLQGADHAYRVLIESMNEGALTLTVDKMILYANECFARMVQCPLQQLIGSSFRRFLSEEDRAILRPLMKEGANTGSKIQVKLLALDGSHLPAQISIRRLGLGKQGLNAAPIGMVVTDMTASHRAAEQQETARLYAQLCDHAAELQRHVSERTAQLLRANQELEAFQSSVSHDLRAPLRHVAGFSQILLDLFAPQLPEEAQDYLKKIQECSGKMDRMIVALLEFSRLSNQSLSLQSVDVGQMWREILAEMKSEMRDRRIEVTIGELPPCYADPTLLHHVLVNLLNNALKYSRTRECSQVEITALSPATNGATTYSIKDNGVGFDMANADKLFAVFSRLHSTNDFEGTGVGLTTAHRIIQRHGGRIWAESTPGLGATFFFHTSPLPAAPEAPAAALDPKSTGPARKPRAAS